jgi:serine/threonine-protein kinase HipA
VELQVLLGPQDVGRIVSSRDDRHEFAFSSEYLRSPKRPVLGQYFEDHLDEAFRSRQRLPAFFSNLLPEGGLRELLARRAGVHPEREALLLAHLGDDLPGAVIVKRLDDDDAQPDAIDVEQATELPEEGELRFSLAGVQLKFSVLYQIGSRGPTIPVNGRGGNWIAKLPSNVYEHVPENEFSMIAWARSAGIRVPEVRLVQAKDIERLPVELDPDRMVFLSQRYDRPEGQERVHQEDFAQVRNIRRDERYGNLSYNGLAKLVRVLAGDDDFAELVRRIVFNVIIGNGDAHLKNWSLTYPDKITPRLSPAYDLVSTVIYIPGDKLALKLGRERLFSRVTMDHFRRLGEDAGHDPDAVVRLVQDTIARSMDAWKSSVKEWPLRDDHRVRLEKHLETLVLLD